MKVIRTQAIMLRYTNYKEADRMLTLFSPNMGKVQAMARGCRKPKSRFLSASQLFCYGDYILYKIGDLNIVSQAEVKDSFYDIRSDVDRFAFASYIVSITEQAINIGEGNYPLFYLLLNVLTHLSYGNIDPQDITHIFELKFMDILGYRPELDECVSCGDNISTVPVFSPEEGGLLCPKCYNRQKCGYTIQMGTVQTMRHILDMDIRKVNVLKMSSSIKEELNTILPSYVSEKIDRKVRSMDFINKINLLKS